MNEYGSMMPVSQRSAISSCELLHKRKRSSPVVTATVFMIVSVLIKKSAATDSCARFKVKRSIAVKLEHLDDCYRYHNRRETDGVCKERSFSNVGRNQNSIMTNIVPYGGDTGSSTSTAKVSSNQYDATTDLSDIARTIMQDFIAELTSISQRNQNDMKALLKSVTLEFQTLRHDISFNNPNEIEMNHKVELSLDDETFIDASAVPDDSVNIEARESDIDSSAVDDFKPPTNEIVAQQTITRLFNKTDAANAHGSFIEETKKHKAKKSRKKTNRKQAARRTATVPDNDTIVLDRPADNMVDSDDIRVDASDVEIDEDDNISDYCHQQKQRFIVVVFLCCGSIFFFSYIYP